MEQKVGINYEDVYEITQKVFVTFELTGFYLRMDEPCVPQQIGDFIFKSRLGKGSYGTVWLAVHRVLGVEVAIKVISKSQLDRDGSQLRFAREVSLMQRMEHPLACHLFQLLEDCMNQYIVMEYVPNGNLQSYVTRKGRLQEDSALRYFIQLIVILEYMHNHLHFAHRDVKAENVMLDKYHNIRLIDFGLSNSFSNGNPNLRSQCGSISYVSPEMIKEQRYTSSVDVWSAGVLLYWMCVGQLPFVDDNLQNVLQKIIYADPHYPSYLSQSLKDLLKKMLIKDPEHRITIEKIKEHPWFSQFEYKTMTIFIQQRLPNENSIQDNQIDPVIVSTMNEYDIDTTFLKQHLFMKNYTEETAIYRIIQTKNLIEQMKTQLEYPSKQRTFSYESIIKMSPERKALKSAEEENCNTLPLPKTTRPSIPQITSAPRILNHRTSYHPSLMRNPSQPRSLNSIRPE